MRQLFLPIPAVFLSFIFLSSVTPVRADEGMWTLNGFPTKKVEKKYGFTATPEWLEHVRLSSARLAEGCSGYIENGKFVKPTTTIAGAFGRNTGRATGSSMSWSLSQDRFSDRSKSISILTST